MTHSRRECHMGQEGCDILQACIRTPCAWGGEHVRALLLGVTAMHTDLPREENVTKLPSIIKVRV